MKRGPLKKIHLPVGEVPLEVECLRDGTLDVCLKSGRVYTLLGGERRELKTREDDDGYLVFDLSRAPKAPKRGKKTEYVDKLKNGKRITRIRYRRRRRVRVHRLVKLKSLALAKGGIRWRQYANDLPRGTDVNHLGAKTDNRDCMLCLETEMANRSRREMTDEEWELQRAAF